MTSCPSGKLRYTKAVALQLAADHAKSNGYRLRVYPCPECRWYHLTSRYEDGLVRKWVKQLREMKTR